MKNADIVGVCLIGGLLFWFVTGKIGEPGQRQQAYQAGKQDQYIRTLELQNAQQQGEIRGLQYPR